MTSTTAPNVLHAINDRLVAPGATGGELLVTYAGALTGSALAVPGFGWVPAAVIYGLALTGAVAVLAAPPDLRRPVAFAVATLAAALALTTLTVPGAFAWFAPVLLVKLLLAHLLP